VITAWVGSPADDVIHVEVPELADDGGDHGQRHGAGVIHQVHAVTVGPNGGYPRDAQFGCERYLALRVHRREGDVRVVIRCSLEHGQEGQVRSTSVIQGRQ